MRGSFRGGWAPRESFFYVVLPVVRVVGLGEVATPVSVAKCFWESLRNLFQCLPLSKSRPFRLSLRPSLYLLQRLSYWN